MNGSKGEKEPGENAVGVATDIALCCWFALVIAAFWGPYIGLREPGIMSALYGLFLLCAVAAAAIRVLRGREAARTAASASDRGGRGDVRH